MGIKSRIEQSIKRARREGRLEDAADFEQDLIALKAQRGQAAMERGRKYTVQPGDSYFSIAADQLGDERWAKSLVQANPEIQFLKPGMIIVIPRARGEAPSFEEQEYEEFKDMYGLDDEPGEKVIDPGLGQDLPTGETAEEGEVAEQPAQPETAPGAMTPEEEDALVDDLVVLFRALEQQGVVQLPKQKTTPTGATSGMPLVKQKATGQKAGASKPVQTPPPPTETPEPDAGQGDEEYLTWEERQRLGAREKQDLLDASESDLIDSDSQDGTQYDLTEWLVEDMVATAVREFGYQFSGDWLTLSPTGPTFNSTALTEFGLFQYAQKEKAEDLFGTGHLKDIKKEMKNLLGDGIVLCGSDECRWLDVSVPGNISFGFNMAASGLLSPIYKWGAGKAQIEDEGLRLDWLPWFDNPQDMAAIEFGAKLFELYKYDLTTEDFKRELTSSILDKFQPVPSNFPIPHEAHPEENGYAPGFFDYKKNEN